MKKIVFILILLLPNTIEAQRISLGYKVGLSSVNQWYSEKVPITIIPRLSYEFGAVLDYKINQYSTLSIEPGFIEKGSIYYLIPIDKVSMKYGYLTTPFIVRFSFYKGFNFEIGNEFGYLIYIKSRLLELNSKPYSESMQNKKKFESSCLIGFSHSFHDRLNLYLKASYSYTPIKTTIWPSQIGTQSVQTYNKYYSLGIRYYFLKSR